MASQLQLAQAEGLCLRYPENLGLHREVNFDSAVTMLLRAIQMATTMPFTWGFIDKPQEGQVILIFIPNHSPFPNDGIRYLEQEVKYNIPAGMRELEVYEAKFGFAPGVDQTAWRVRRRYRLTKGGHPQLILMHYSRGQPIAVPPQFLNQPIRVYPLRPVTEPAVFVCGDKTGQKVYPPGMAPGPNVGMGMGMGIGMNMQQQAMLAQQNNNMEILERKRERERARERGASMAPRPPPRVEEEDSGDEIDMISTKALALTRYRRNHDIMNAVFKHAAYGGKYTPTFPPPYSIFNKTELEDKTNQLSAEIAALNARAIERNAAKALAEQERLQQKAALAFDLGDASMENLSDSIVV
ncbi:uncharacterized protein BT62DRAFT_981111 [Guyanagaster necrorhizus]|uniref:SWI/SNF and RSC complexes subunit Ssr4 N-terminal domain-containing protein n=1 Tax=Guyanagaster necrorhizus TaxID=856835 RepID=A0A9P7VSL6_9AGAR|nr:uncharacterized protein BT62DRAFT_981111 [Guyanagaster necrorhizus MCA 3950]KAG7445710.1 hypothetical protein BT62DRAFT_981111 [Guyanagaster necrorhizus MCA 3950]